MLLNRDKEIKKLLVEVWMGPESKDHYPMLIKLLEKCTFSARFWLHKVRNGSGLWLPKIAVRCGSEHFLPDDKGHGFLWLFPFIDIIGWWIFTKAQKRICWAWGNLKLFLRIKFHKCSFFHIILIQYILVPLKTNFLTMCHSGGFLNTLSSKGISNCNSIGTAIGAVLHQPHCVDLIFFLPGLGTGHLPFCFKVHELPIWLSICLESEGFPCRLGRHRWSLCKGFWASEIKKFIMHLTQEKHDQNESFPVTVFRFSGDICGRISYSTVGSAAYFPTDVGFKHWLVGIGEFSS